MDTHSFPLIRTKLHRPPLTAETIGRGRLLEVMDRALELPLTVVPAPAGYGKGTLVSQWAESLEKPSAWLSLDAEESDLTLLMRDFLAAIGKVFPADCPEARALVTTPNPVPLRILGGTLANELDTMASRIA